MQISVMCFLTSIKKIIFVYFIKKTLIYAQYQELQKNLFLNIKT